MRMPRFKDLPIAIKSVVAPIAGALITVAIVVVVMLVDNVAMRSAAEADDAERLATAVTAARLEFVQGHGAMFRAVGWRGANVDVAKVDAAAKEALAEIQRADEMVRKLPVRAGQSAKAEALGKLLAGYREAAQ